jgi:hypothetical protein
VVLPAASDTFGRESADGRNARVHVSGISRPDIGTDGGLSDLRVPDHTEPIRDTRIVHGYTGN